MHPKNLLQYKYAAVALFAAGLVTLLGPVSNAQTIPNPTTAQAAQGGVNVVSTNGSYIVAQAGDNFQMQLEDQYAIALPGSRVPIVKRASHPPAR